ncbi:MAG: glucosamine-6-phosphate deaminase [Eubacteriales bacterium]
MRLLKKDQLQVKIVSSRDEMGKIAAADIRERILSLLGTKKQINMIFAAAPSQNDVLAYLTAYDDIDWQRINAYHMDEYIGLAGEWTAQSFGTYLENHIFGVVPFRTVNLIAATASDPESECERYAKLLADNPADIVVLGVGENGHIAFNDPWVADFNDPKAVKVVTLDEACRQQQVNDGCFSSIDLVPKQAITLTCPTMTKPPYLFCVVPSKTKANAVRHMLNDEIGEDCPATILRRHACATLYLDGESSSLL